MGTPCDLYRVTETGHVTAIHVSYDGYLAGVGLTLFKHYQVPEALDALFVASGDVASLECNPYWNDLYSTEEIVTLDNIRANLQSNMNYMVPEHSTAEAYEKDWDTRTYLHAKGHWHLISTPAHLHAALQGDPARRLTKDILMTHADIKEDEFEISIEDMWPALSSQGLLERAPGDPDTYTLRLSDADIAILVLHEDLLNEARALEGQHVTVQNGAVSAQSSWDETGQETSVTHIQVIRIFATPTL